MPKPQSHFFFFSFVVYLQQHTGESLGTEQLNRAGRGAKWHCGVGAAELRRWVGGVGRVRACALNPTNPTATAPGRVNGSIHVRQRFLLFSFLTLCIDHKGDPELWFGEVRNCWSCHYEADRFWVLARLVISNRIIRCQSGPVRTVATFVI